jgi:hypothetical protein
MKYKARVACYFDIEYELEDVDYVGDANDTDLTIENIEMSTVVDLLCKETEDSVQSIFVKKIEKLL